MHGGHKHTAPRRRNRNTTTTRLPQTTCITNQTKHTIYIIVIIFIFCIITSKMYRPSRLIFSADNNHSQ